MLSLALRIDYQGKIENQLDYFKIVQRMDRQQKRGKRKVKTLEKLLGRK
jgi:hypothetical protein